MPTELTMLALAVLLTLAQLLAAVLLAMGQVPLPVLMGNREAEPAVTGIAGRARRAHRNMLEMLPLFAALVLLVVAAGRTSHATAVAAAVFVAARAAYALVYLIGVPWLRTAVWGVSLAALVPFLTAALLR